MGSKLVLSMRASGTLADPFPSPQQTPDPGSSAWPGPALAAQGHPQPWSSRSDSPVPAHPGLGDFVVGALVRLRGCWQELDPSPSLPHPMDSGHGALCQADPSLPRQLSLLVAAILPVILA